MFASILAGIMIGLGGILNLKIGGVLGAILFAIGLFTIVNFNLNLFTGKVGLLLTKEVSIWQLIIYWIGNFIGTELIALIVFFTPIYDEIKIPAEAIVQVRNSNSYINILLGIFCGLLMYIAVTGYKQTKNALFIFIPVVAFILGGFNHCIADMFYTWIGHSQLLDFLPILYTSIGNALGAQIIPIGLSLDK